MTNHPPTEPHINHGQRSLAVVELMNRVGSLAITERMLSEIGDRRHPHSLATQAGSRWVHFACTSSATGNDANIRGRFVPAPIEAPTPRGGARLPVGDRWFVADTEGDAVSIVDLGGDAPSRAGRVSRGTTVSKTQFEFPQDTAPSNCFTTDRAPRNAHT